MIVRRSAAVFTGICVAATVSGGMAGPAVDVTSTVPSDSGGDSMGSALVSRQETLFDYADWVQEQDASLKDGFIAVVNDAPTLSTEILWESGKEGNAEYLMQKAASMGISASLASRENGLAEIDATIEGIESLPPAAIPRGFEIDVILGLQAEFDGVEVVLKESDEAPPASRSTGDDGIADAEILSSVAEEFAEHLDGLPSSVRVSVVSGEGVVPAAVVNSSEGSGAARATP